MYDKLLELSLGSGSLNNPLIDRVSSHQSVDNHRTFLTNPVAAILRLQITLWILPKPTINIHITNGQDEKTRFYTQQHVMLCASVRGVRVSVCPCGCHTLRLYKNGASYEYDHEIFTVDWHKDSSFSICKVFFRNSKGVTWTMALNERGYKKLMI